MTKLQQFTYVCAPSIVQYAGAAALDFDIGPIVADYKQKRDRLATGLRGLYDFALPGGAFYAFANIAGTGMSSRALADFLLEEAGVACLSGASFGHAGEGYLRFSYANSLENLEEAVKRISGAQQKWTGDRI